MINITENNEIIGISRETLDEDRIYIEEVFNTKNNFKLKTKIDICKICKYDFISKEILETICNNCMFNSKEININDLKYLINNK